MPQKKKTTAKKKTVTKKKTTALDELDQQKRKVPENDENDTKSENSNGSSLEGVPSQPPDDSWFKTGDEGYKEMQRQKAAAQQRKEKAARRFYLKYSEENTIIFLDDPRIYIWEHEIKTPDKDRMYLTCTKEYGPCLTCNSDNTSYYIAYGTIYNTKKYTRKDGEEVRVGRCLFGAKSNIVDRIRDLIKEHGSLKGCVFDVKRYDGTTEPKVGSNFKFRQKIDLKQLPSEDREPLDYRKILAFPTPEELASVGIGGKVYGSYEDTGGQDKQDLDDSLSFL